MNVLFKKFQDYSSRAVLFKLEYIHRLSGDFTQRTRRFLGLGWGEEVRVSDKPPDDTDAASI